MKRTQYYVLMVLSYLFITISTLEFIKNDSKKYLAHLHALGIIGQFMLAIVAYRIYLSGSVAESVYLYMCIYVVFIIMFSLSDMALYISDRNGNFYGKLESDNPHDMFVDFAYYNISVISTISYGDITPRSSYAKLYFIYKVVVVIFVCTFLLNDIVAKSG